MTRLYEGQEHHLTPPELVVLTAVSRVSLGNGLHCEVDDDPRILQVPSRSLPRIDVPAFNDAVQRLETAGLIQRINHISNEYGTHRGEEGIPDVIGEIVAIDLKTTPLGERELRYVLAARQRRWADLWAKVVGSAIGTVFTIAGALAVAGIVRWLWPSGK